MKMISLKLPDELLAGVESEAKARRVTKSELVRESFEAGLYKQVPRKAASCYDLAHDLAGIIKGLPEDIATNPKYADGFGE